MAPPHPVELFFAVALVVFIVGGVIAFYRWSLTMYHIPRLVLVLLTITVALCGIVGVGGTAWDAEQAGGSLGHGFALMFYIYGGFIGTFVLLVASLFKSFKMSLSIIFSLCSAVGFVLFGITLPGPFLTGFVSIGTLAGVPALTGILTWVALRAIEKSSQKTFGERMKQ
jgi:hypothetical protein